MWYEKMEEVRKNTREVTFTTCIVQYMYSTHVHYYIYIFIDVPCYCILTGSEVLPELRLGLDEELWGRRGAEWRWMVVDGRCRGATIRAVWWRRHGVSTRTGWGGGRWPQKPVDLLSIVEATSVYLCYGHIEGKMKREEEEESLETSFCCSVL